MAGAAANTAPARPSAFEQDTPHHDQPLSPPYSENPVLLIDSHSSQTDLINAADQRLRAAGDLLETLYCLCFKQADVKDIPNIVNALYLLVQDGCDLLEVAKQRPAQSAYN